MTMMLVKKSAKIYLKTEVKFFNLCKIFNSNQSKVKC